MSFGPPHAFTTDLHPPPSFWSTSAPKKAPASNTATCDGDRAPYAATATKGSDGTPEHIRDALPVHREAGSGRTKGSAVANTVCSALRRVEVSHRHRRKPRSAAATADRDGGIKLDDGGLGSVELRGGSKSNAAGGQRRRRRRRGCSGGGPCNEGTARRFLDGAGGATAVDESGDGVEDSSGGGRFSPKTAMPPPAARECWGNDGRDDDGDDDGGDQQFQSYYSAGASRSSSRGSRRGRTDRERGSSSNESPTRILSWAPLGSETDAREAKEGWPVSPGLRKGAEQAGGDLFDDVSPPRSSAGSPRRSKGIGRGIGIGDPATGLAFAQIQRDLLTQLEKLFVTIADERRKGLVALKREEEVWKASAIERAKRDLRTASAGRNDGDDNGSNSNSNSSNTATAHPSGGRSLEERVRERVVEEGPGPEALEAVGLVRNREEAFRRSGEGGGTGKGRGGWRLPHKVVEEMREDFRRKLDEECNQVLEQENKALLEARAGLAEREGARTERELRELSDRLTNDGRDALACLQRQLEKEEEERLAAERENLKEALAHSLQQERERLVSERELRIAKAQDASRRELSRLAEDLWEQAERSATERREEAVRLLDQAADKARAKLEALLTAHEKQNLDSLRDRSASERKALVKKIREEGNRQFVQDLNTLAESASKKNEAWVRMTVGDLAQTRQDDGARREKGKGKQGVLVSPALQMRATEASEDCTRLSRRLVELVMKEATMRLKESDLPPESSDQGRGTNTTTDGDHGKGENIGSNNTSSNNNNNDFRAEAYDDGRGGCSGRYCEDCDRLARANAQLSRLLLRTAAAGTPEDGWSSSAAVQAGTALKKAATATGNREVRRVAAAGKKRATKKRPTVGGVPTGRLLSLG